MTRALPARNRAAASTSGVVTGAHLSVRQPCALVRSEPFEELRRRAGAATAALACRREPARDEDADRRLLRLDGKPVYEPRRSADGTRGGRRRRRRGGVARHPPARSADVQPRGRGRGATRLGGTADRVVSGGGRVALEQPDVPGDDLERSRTHSTGFTQLGKRDPPYLHDKVIGLISAAGGTQGLQAINTMEFAVRALRGWAVPYVVPVAAAHRIFDREGRIQDEGIELLKTLGAEVVRVAERFADDKSLHREHEASPSGRARGRRLQGSLSRRAIGRRPRGRAPDAGEPRRTARSGRVGTQALQARRPGRRARGTAPPR